MSIRDNLKKHKLDIRNWAKLEADIIYSDAFSTLTATDIRMLIRFLQKRKYKKKSKRSKEIVYDNKNIIFTYTEAECLGIPRSSCSRSIKNLIRKGFIEIEHQGGRFQGRDWSTYNLIDDYMVYGTDKFKPREKEPVATYSESIKKYNNERTQALQDLTGKILEFKRPNEKKHKKAIPTHEAVAPTAPTRQIKKPKLTEENILKVKERRDLEKRASRGLINEFDDSEES